MTDELTKEQLEELAIDCLAETIKHIDKSPNVQSDISAMAVILETKIMLYNKAMELLGDDHLKVEINRDLCVAVATLKMHEDWLLEFLNSQSGAVAEVPNTVKIMPVES